jgi:hypothetical protein
MVISLLRLVWLSRIPDWLLRAAEQSFQAGIRQVRSSVRTAFPKLTPRLREKRAPRVKRMRMDRTFATV